MIGGKATFLLAESDESDVQWSFTVSPVHQLSQDCGMELLTGLHFEGAKLPRRSHILASFQEMWNRSLEFAAALDAGA